MSDSKGGGAKPASKPASKSKAKNQSGNDGFTAGLQYWLLFLVILVLLRFPLALAVVFGAIAGLAGGFLVGWWEDTKQLKGQERDIEIRNPGALAGMDANILLNPDAEYSEEYVDPRQKRRSRYVSNRPYRVEDRRRVVNSVFAWRRAASRPRQQDPEG